MAVSQKHIGDQEEKQNLVIKNCFEEQESEYMEEL
jgi:hypothetical protein